MTKYLFIFIQNLSLLFQKNIPLFSLKVGKVLSEPYNNHYFFILIVPNICNIVQSGKCGKSQKIFFFAASFCYDNRKNIVLKCILARLLRVACNEVNPEF